jgi:hypothetical protein
MNKLFFQNEPYFLSDTTVYFSVRDVESPYHILDTVVVYKSPQEGYYSIWEVSFELEEINPKTIRDWLVSEQAVTEGGSFGVSTKELPEALVECGVSLELQKESFTNSTFRMFIDFLNIMKNDVEPINNDSVYPLLYKYWLAECGEQEIGEDLSDLIHSDCIFEAKEYIRNCHPSQLDGRYATEYQEYVHLISED